MPLKKITDVRKLKNEVNSDHPLKLCIYKEAGQNFLSPLSKMIKQIFFVCVQDKSAMVKHGLRKGRRIEVCNVPCVNLSRSFSIVEQLHLIESVCTK